MGGLFGKNPILRLNWRALIAVVVAYAIAAQSLLIVLGGFSAAARAETATSSFEICRHDPGAPGLPADVPGHPNCTHCIFCFAGSHHAVMGTPPSLFARFDAVPIKVAALFRRPILPDLSAHSIASPRGPPLTA